MLAACANSVSDWFFCVIATSKFSLATSSSLISLLSFSSASSFTSTFSSKTNAARSSFSMASDNLSSASFLF